MNIREALLRDRSKANCQKIVAYIGNNKDLCKKWVNCLLVPDPVLNAKAAWVLSFLTDNNPSIVDSYQMAFLTKLKEEENHDAVLRAVCRHWAEYGFPEEIEGEVYDLCLGYLQSNKAIAIKAHAMQSCFKVVTKYPDLALEYKLVLEEVILKYGEESAGIRSRGNKLLKKLRPYL
ncbi:MAG: hypothetical protein ACI9IP_002429 [Arcticibacterium sp.]|jgi:hypothetical protein